MALDQNIGQKLENYLQKNKSKKKPSRLTKADILLKSVGSSLQQLVMQNNNLAVAIKSLLGSKDKLLQFTRQAERDALYKIIEIEIRLAIEKIKNQQKEMSMPTLVIKSTEVPKVEFATLHRVDAQKGDNLPRAVGTKAVVKMMEAPKVYRATMHSVQEIKLQTDKPRANNDGNQAMIFTQSKAKSNNNDKKPLPPTNPKSHPHP